MLICRFQKSIADNPSFPPFSFSSFTPFCPKRPFLLPHCRQIKSITLLLNSYSTFLRIYSQPFSNPKVPEEYRCFWCKSIYSISTLVTLDANNVDLSQFERWYNQAGTPIVEATEVSYNLRYSRHCYYTTISHICLFPDLYENAHNISLNTSLRTRLTLTHTNALTQICTHIHTQTCKRTQIQTHGFFRSQYSSSTIPPKGRLVFAVRFKFV